MLHSSVDYLTLTFLRGERVSDRQRHRIQATELRAMLVWCKRSGDAVREWAWNGYRGEGTSTFSYGEREDGLIVRASGDTAGRLAQLTVGKGRASRLDLQVTEWPDCDVDQLIHHSALASDKARKSAKHRPWKVTHLNAFGDGDTLYIGSRESETFLRMYNKGLESADNDYYTGAVRYEVEYKGARADNAFRALEGSRDHGDYCFSRVAGEFRARGVTAAWMENYGSGRIADTPTEESEVDQTLRWLERQVKPSVVRLRELGLARSDLSATLGLESVL